MLPIWHWESPTKSSSTRRFSPKAMSRANCLCAPIMFCRQRILFAHGSCVCCFEGRGRLAEDSYEWSMDKVLHVVLSLALSGVTHTGNVPNIRAVIFPRKCIWAQARSSVACARVAKARARIPTADGIMNAPRPVTDANHVPNVLHARPTQH